MAKSINGKAKTTRKPGCEREQVETRKRKCKQKTRLDEAGFSLNL
ncbi:MAG TPA: hypothetical protein VFY63_06855 [Pseudorhizobium sp.]|nr:hypothetical protein [Pseudorhizobium sp.]